MASPTLCNATVQELLAAGLTLFEVCHDASCGHTVNRHFNLNLVRAAEPAPVPSGITNTELAELISTTSKKQRIISKRQNMALHNQSIALKKQLHLTKYLTKEVVISHRLRMDIWSSSNRTKVEQADFKEKLISYYRRGHPTKFSKIKCMVLDVFLPRETVIASHIWKFCTKGEGLTEFRLLPSDLGSPRNGLLLCQSIQKAFDSKKVCFLVDKICFLDIAIRQEKVHNDSKLTFENIDGWLLQHPIENIPFRRILDFHAKMSYENAIKKQWLPSDTKYEHFFNMSINSSIPDLNIYQNLFENIDDENYNYDYDDNNCSDDADKCDDADYCSDDSDNLSNNASNCSDDADICSDNADNDWRPDDYI
eukprot:gene3710-7375_t